MAFLHCRHTEQKEQWLQGRGWRAWASRVVYHEEKATPQNELDRIRRELRGDFRSALRHACLGPRRAHHGPPSMRV